LKQTVISFGLLVFTILVLVQIAKFSRFQSPIAFEIWIVVFSILFLCIGIFLSRKLSTPKVIREEIIVERSAFKRNDAALQKLDLSKREFEILQLINDGLSNAHIAQKLFLSENTIKKHISNLFFKMDVERRTEAIRKAKELRIIQ